MSLRQSLRFPSPLIEPDVPISGIRLSDWFHREAHGSGPRCTRRRRSTPRAPKICSAENLAGAAPLHLVPSSEEVAHRVVDVVVDGAICHQARAVAEVRRPAPQNRVELVADLGPRLLVARDQKLADLGLEPPDAFLGRARAQIPMTILAMVIWSERVAKEVEVFLAGILQLGFHLVEREPELGHHRLRPRQRLGRMSAAEDDEVVGIGDDMSVERLAACGVPPMLQEAVHVQVGQHRTGDAALRRAARRLLASRHAPPSLTVPFLDRRLQPQLDQPQHMPVDDASGHRFEEVRMRDGVEVFRQIGVNHVGVAPAYQPVHFLDGIGPAAAGPIAISAVLEVRLEDRFQHQLGGGLDHPIPDRRDAERAFAAPRLRDHHPPHRCRPVRLLGQFLPQACQPLL